MAIPHRDVGGILKKHGYAELKKIGEGSFGKAILVQADDASKLVCKLVDVSQASAKETQDAVKEGRLLAAFKHPYVVRYRESFIDCGWLCIVMDYCEGGDLTKQIETAKKRRQSIPEDQVLRWMCQALLAIKYIHDKHVLHRDLKSGNFFLSKSGNLKMGDFGIAKVLSCTAACAKTQIGTPYYLSPEVCQEKPYTWPSDIWAMGCILYELCALKVPFDAPNISGLVQKICRGPTPILPAGYSDFTKQLCGDMLNRSANSRPSAESILQRPQMQAVVKQMLEQAQAAQDGQPSSTGASDGLERPVESQPRAPANVVAPAFAGAGPYSLDSGGYRKNDLVEYYSNTHNDWLPATVLNTDSDGRIIIDLKPNTWIPREAQAQQVRPRRRNSGNQGQVAPRACPSPLRQRSPSVSRVDSGRNSSPWLGAADGYRAPSPGYRRNREPSPFGAGGAPAAGSRAGTPSRSSTPNRVASPRGGAYVPRYDPGCARPAADQGNPRGPPGMPRGPMHQSPLSQPRRPFNAAGMVIAGV